MGWIVIDIFHINSNSSNNNSNRKKRNKDKNNTKYKNVTMRSALNLHSAAIICVHSCNWLPLIFFSLYIYIWRARHIFFSLVCMTNTSTFRLDIFHTYNLKVKFTTNTFLSGILPFAYLLKLLYKSTGKWKEMDRE